MDASCVYRRHQLKIGFIFGVCRPATAVQGRNGWKLYSNAHHTVNVDGMKPGRGRKVPRLLFRRLPRRKAHCHAAITRLPPRSTTKPHTHDFPECFLVLAGEGRHCRPKQQTAMVPGQLVWIEPSDVHWFETGEHSLEFANLALAPAWWERFRALARPALNPGRARGTPVSLDPETRVFLEGQLPRILTETGDRGAPLLGWLMRAVEALAADASRSVADNNRPPEWLQKLLRNLEDPAWLKEPVSSWQRSSGRNKAHLARACRRYCGVTLTELLQRARITRAKRLLLGGDMKVTTVVAETGFGNVGHFHAVFKRKTGLTPREWQRQHWAGTVPRN
jgi:AraC family cel operon transcriptional repressor